ncbi:Outward-rectifier potassium channel [Zalerion maritima]|uniref:Outward-rectifier potassium channel n=1 Tax=Zalerion maritima TaxID=339359 RepID=A0AAD5RN77_9PEZI|nr:Outward-rectifier potassium channel [Zalerion maritima]
MLMINILAQSHPTNYDVLCLVSWRIGGVCEARGVPNDPDHPDPTFRRRQKLLLLREEEDRFDLMREIQSKIRKFKNYWALPMAIMAFVILWTAGATVFIIAEHRLQQYSFFDALCFAFAALLTIGDGDLQPSSNIGKPFFVIWSVVAVPTMTVFIQEMSSTVVAGAPKGTFKLADWTVLPKKGILKRFLDSHPNTKGGLLSSLIDLQSRISHNTNLQGNWQTQLRGLVARTILRDLGRYTKKLARTIELPLEGGSKRPETIKEESNKEEDEYVFSPGSIWLQNHLF